MGATWRASDGVSITSGVMEADTAVRYVRPMMRVTTTFGEHLREWRQRRRMSQLDLAVDAEISSRHLSFVETGRSQPSREMVLHLAERLDVPLRERNILLAAAGYAPVFSERSLDDPALEGARRAVDLVLEGHEPFPALAIDRHWTLIASNAAVAPLLVGVAAALLKPPVNVLRLSLHPDGLAPRIANLPEWRAHLLDRVRRQVEISADPILVDLLAEFRSYPVPRPHLSSAASSYGGIVVPFRLVTEAGVLSFFSTTTVFGTPIDITLSELAIESFFPADAATGKALQGRIRQRR
jgi:transcriptional regulator with XRE-family HTH domain